jgi:hypothetical protein
MPYSRSAQSDAQPDVPRSFVTFANAAWAQARQTGGGVFRSRLFTQCLRATGNKGPWCVARKQVR